MPQVVNPQPGEACLSAGGYPSRVQHALNRSRRFRDIAGAARLPFGSASSAVVLVNEHELRMYAALLVDDVLRDRIEHHVADLPLCGRAATALDKCSGHLEHRERQRRVLDFPIPAQITNDRVAHARIQNEQRHFRKMLGQKRQQPALLGPGDLPRLALIALQRQHGDHRNVRKQRLSRFGVAPLECGKPQDPPYQP
ncbi:MAG: hypothetical protein RMK97_06990 [Sutterellaceae bacterium]|nr:hypothetical protein [Burkholderiaceae bacterium]MDW8430233.1 hypothetical protein [Sutterellaceae bacterium]